MRTLSVFIMTLTVSAALVGCGPNQKEKQLQEFITTHVEKVKPMHRETSLAYWDAATSGKPDDYEKVSELTLKIRHVYSDPEDFAFLKKSKESGQLKDPALA
ncbi:MAG: hypothetical protein U9Q07_02690, partial [Planctomycetota bacterium]|nr:hypothetical protein [Planctomycetota bacterium]